MKVILPMILISLVLIIFLIYHNWLIIRTKDISLIKRFKNNSKKRKNINRRYYESYWDSLLINPMNNIKINPWDKEAELLEKVNIHKSRLKKFGESKMNDQIYYKGPKGGIFTISNKGNKKYV